MGSEIIEGTACNNVDVNKFMENPLSVCDSFIKIMRYL